MASKPKLRFTPEEYLAMERKAEYKSEYIDGEIVAMVGASEPHNLIVTNLVAQIHSQLKNRQCRVYSSDMRVDIRERGLFAYPDVVVLCGAPEFSEEIRDNLRNPNVIIEVLSKSTESYDRGIKFMKYRRIESLSEYVLVAQDRYHIEHFIRQANDQWLLTEAGSLDATIKLSSMGCVLKLSEVYDKVELKKQTINEPLAKGKRKRKL